MLRPSSSPIHLHPLFFFHPFTGCLAISTAVALVAPWADIFVSDWLQSEAGRHDAKYFEPWYSCRFGTKQQIQEIYTLAKAHSEKKLALKSLSNAIQKKKTAMWAISAESFSSQVNCRSVLSIRNEFEKFSIALCCTSFMNHCPNSVCTSKILELLSPTFTVTTEQLIMSPNACSTLLK